jgi:hypothetical protein
MFGCWLSKSAMPLRTLSVSKGLASQPEKVIVTGASAMAAGSGSRVASSSTVITRAMILGFMEKPPLYLGSLLEPLDGFCGRYNFPEFIHLRFDKPVIRDGRQTPETNRKLQKLAI